jgi:hypothetical protein
MPAESRRFRTRLNEEGIMAEADKKLMKCFNCAISKGILKGYDYVGGKTCPNCGINADDPLAGNMIFERATIHYEGPHPVIGNRGDGLRYCDGQPIRCFEYVGKSSGEWAAVTCPDCLAKKEGESGS